MPNGHDESIEKFFEGTETDAEKWTAVKCSFVHIAQRLEQLPCNEMKKRIEDIEKETEAEENIEKGKMSVLNIIWGLITAVLGAIVYAFIDKKVGG